MSVCEVCEGRAEKTCGYDEGALLDFCTEDYIEHLEATHPINAEAQREAEILRAALKKSERVLLANQPKFDHAFVPNKQCSGLTCDVCDNTKERHNERDKVLRRRRAAMPDYDKRLEEWLS